MVIKVFAGLLVNCFGVFIALTYFYKAFKENDWYFFAVGSLIVIISYLISIWPLTERSVDNGSR